MANSVQLLFIILLCGSCQSWAQEGKFTWPNGAKAAVCLTYDDGIDSQLDIAIPDLDRENLRGTFFIQGDNLTPARIDKWKIAAKTGHELANHTIFHPCSRKLDFVWEEFASEIYTARRLILEMGVMNNFLYSLDGQDLRTYAYTCDETEFGGISVVDSLRESGLFIGIRGGFADGAKEIKELDLFQLPSLSANVDNAKDMIPYAEEARDTGGLAVFTFHGVGGDYLHASREDHYELLQYLKANKEDYWVAPFREVIQHIIKEKDRLGWD